MAFAECPCFCSTPPQGGVGGLAGPGNEAAGLAPTEPWDPGGAHPDPCVWGQATAQGVKNGGSGCCTQGEEGTPSSIPGPTQHTQITKWSHLGFMQILKVKSKWS